MGLTIKIVVNGKDKSALFSQYLKRVLIEDWDGIKADKLQIVLNNQNGALALPEASASIQVFFDDVDMGAYVVTTPIELDASQTIVGRGAYAPSLRVKKYRDWHETTLSNIINSIAREHGLKAAISADLASQLIAHRQQFNESDINLISRLGTEFGAIVKLSAGRLVFVSKNGKTASGQSLPIYTHKRLDNDLLKINHANGHLSLKTQGQALYKAGVALVVQSKQFSLSYARHDWRVGTGFFTHVRGKV